MTAPSRLVGWRHVGKSATRPGRPTTQASRPRQRQEQHEGENRSLQLTALNSRTVSKSVQQKMKAGTLLQARPGWPLHLPADDTPARSGTDAASMALYCASLRICRRIILI
jgi:hypothetical protein